MRIEQLRELTDDEARAVITGYQATSRWLPVVTADEDRMVVDLRLEPVGGTYARTWSPDADAVSRYRRIIRDGLSYKALDERGDIAGLVLTQRRDWNALAVVHELHVTRKAQDGGVGSALLSTVESAAATLGLRAVTIETQNTNPRAIGFYRARGYDLTGVDLAMYDGDAAGEVALFFTKHL